MRDAGSSPKAVRAENLPPTSDGDRKILRKPLSSASLIKGVSGSVIAMKWRPQSPFPCPTLFQKYLKRERVSIVVPDLLDTMKRVLLGSILLSTLLTAVGWVLSRTKSSG